MKKPALVHSGDPTVFRNNSTNLLSQPNHLLLFVTYQIFRQIW